MNSSMFKQQALSISIASLILCKHSECLILHLKVNNFVPVEQLLRIVDAVAINLLLCLRLKDVAKAVELITAVNKGIVISAAAK